MTDAEEKSALLEWFSGDDTGSSSQTLARETAGIAHKSRWGVSYPSDCNDLGRCLRLIKAVPGARKAVDRLAAISPHWAALAKEWDALAALAETDPKSVYAAMKACLDRSERADPNIVPLGGGLKIIWHR